MWKIGSGTASVARAFSANLDGLLDNKMSDAFAESLPIAGDFLAPYADMFAFGITIVLAGELYRAYPRIRISFLSSFLHAFL